MGFFKADIKSLFLIRAVFKKISFQLTKKVTNWRGAVYSRDKKA